MEWRDDTDIRLAARGPEPGAGREVGRHRMNQRRNRRGFALAWTAVVLVVMIGLVGLSIDWGWATLDAHQLQNAGDAAAMAGAISVKKAFHDGTLSAAFERARTLSMANYAAGSAVDVCFDAATNNPALDVVIGQWFPSTKEFRAFDPADPKGPNAVKVVTRHEAGWSVNQPLALSFGSLFGTPTANVKREAIAMAYGGGGAGLICLAPDGKGLELEGASKVAVYGVGGAVGEIWVNSNWDADTKEHAVEPGNRNQPVVDEAILEDPDALVNASEWAIYCAQLNVHGEADPLIVDSYDGGEVYPVVNHAPVIPDPLEWLPELRTDIGLPADGYAVQVDATGTPLLDASGNYIPVVGLNPNDTVTSANIDAGDPGVVNIGGIETLTLAPGYYSGGFRMTSAGTYKLKLLPGVYAVGGANPASGLVVSGGAFEALGCMLYVTQSKTGQWGEVGLNGSESNGAKIDISEYKGGLGQPGLYADYAEAGMAVFQDRSNPNDAVFTGGSASSFAGTLYFHNESTWNTRVSLGGNSGNLGIQVVTDRLLVHGTKSMVTIMYDGRNFKPSKKAFLVK